MADDISYENPFQFPQLSDTANIGGRQTPGLCKIVGAKRHYEWDEKKGKGTSGAHATYQGDKPEPFDMVLRLWKSSQIEEWIKLRDEVLTYRTGKKVEAIGILHRTTIGVGIAAVDVVDVGALEYQGGGLWQVTVKLREHKFPAPTPATTPSTTKSATKPGAAAAPVAKDANEQEMQKLLAELNKP